MKTIRFVLFTIAALISCGYTHDSNSGSGQVESKAKLEAVNIVVLLDLSDRIITTAGQADKDRSIIKSILDKFEERQRRQIYITSNDRLRLLVAAQPGVNVSSNDDLVIDMVELRRRKEGQAVGKEAFDAARKKFNSALSNLYEKALKSPHTGADIYTFFCSDYPVSIMSTDPKIKNKLIVLTDGYLTFDPVHLSKRPKCSYMRNLTQLRAAKQEWESYFQKNNLALCPCDRKFKNTEVLLLETAPLNKGASVYEYDIVAHYWKKWFDAMALAAQIFPHDGQVSNISNKVKTFLER